MPFGETLLSVTWNAAGIVPSINNRFARYGGSNNIVAIRSSGGHRLACLHHRNDSGLLTRVFGRE
jgi:hypothetical protein